MSPFDEDDLLPISALQHLVFCERQCALIHLECIWAENVLTAEGRIMHERVHEPETAARGDVRISRGVRLRSLRLGLTGKADVVEFHRLEDAKAHHMEQGQKNTGVILEGTPGLWSPAPVEYKRGRPKPDRCDDVQLCAQAICIEEMLGVAVPRGAVFYGKPRRRLDVVFDEKLRAETESAARQLHELARSGKTPAARYEKKCESCSLLSICMPKVTGSGRSVGRYLAGAFKEKVEEPG